MPFHADCVGIVGIIFFADQRQRISHLQIIPNALAGIVLKTRQWLCAQDDAPRDASLRRRTQQHQDNKYPSNFHSKNSNPFTTKITENGQERKL